MGHVCEHFGDPDLCVPALAQVYNISEKYCYAFFKEQTGLSPAAYIQQLRLEHAARLLRETDLSAQDVGAQSGF
ncbi:MAG TPA: helix-turn-helix transcriptional regulator, partial [Clostridia bacterium]|nr:helix-turn-helix transcriptional regulator [Clostridia bacterium]